MKQAIFFTLAAFSVSTISFANLTLNEFGSIPVLASQENIDLICRQHDNFSGYVLEYGDTVGGFKVLSEKTSSNGTRTIEVGEISGLGNQYVQNWIYERPVVTTFDMGKVEMLKTYREREFSGAPTSLKSLKSVFCYSAPVTLGRLFHTETVDNLGNIVMENIQYRNELTDHPVSANTGSLEDICLDYTGGSYVSHEEVSGDLTKIFFQYKAGKTSRFGVDLTFSKDGAVYGQLTKLVCSKPNSN